MTRADKINALIGKPYRQGAQGPDEFDCYSLARTIQKEVFDRDLPPFQIAAEAGRFAIAAAIAVHPERANWVAVDKPVDGAFVEMSCNSHPYHVGVWVADDGGLIIHAIDEAGVVADTVIGLQAVGWRKFRFLTPAK